MPTTAIIGGAAGNATATTTVVSGTAGYAIRVLEFELSSSGAATVAFKNHTAASFVSGTLFLPSGGVTVNSPSLGLDENRGHFQTASGDSLDLALIGGSVSIGGTVVYNLVGQ